MHRKLLIPAAALISGVFAPLAPARDVAPDLPTPSPLNPALATDLYRNLSQSEGNVFFSPYSISEAMGMAYLGAKGDTAKEFVDALGLDPDPLKFAKEAESLRIKLGQAANQKNDMLRIANALCVTGMKPLESYLQAVHTRFDAEVFGGGLDEINGWVKKKTEGNIEKILESLDANSACVLLNAVYFKGSWQNPFDANDSYDGEFHPTPGASVKARMMQQRGGFATARTAEWVAVELPYQTSCSMVLLMPTDPAKFKAFETGLNEAVLAKVYQQLKGNRTTIELTLPKFKIATTCNLVGPLKQLGMNRAFVTGQADFTAMYEREDIFISQIVHKATLAVDELGSVASAATAVELAANDIPEPVPQIEFDRPFIVLIRENNTHSTLFMGRISDPTK